VTANKAYFRVRQSVIDDGYLTKLAKAGLGGGVKNADKRQAPPQRRSDVYWESAVVHWHAVFDEAPLRAIAANMLAVMRRIGRPDDLNLALHIEVHVDWELPHTGVPVSPSTLRLLADLDAAIDIDIVPNLSPPAPEP
jgi:hypothetical protein